jgi:ubiquinone/menaquinone biosynthesis C-methylase UbiE
MMWQGVIETYGKRKDELLAELDRYDRLGPGSVQWDPAFVYPDYFASVEFHIQPGNYHADPLAGYIYHYGTKIFFLSRNDDDQVQRTLVRLSPAPADGLVRRILDLGCSVGQAATAFKERYPEAEVWGIDVGAPMVRYAHKRAVDIGLEVHFKQALAEATGFPDASFDIVHAFILFHEVPLAIGERIVREAHRLLRPGGLFIVEDFPTNIPRRPNTSPRRDDGGEPYADDYVHSDFHGLIRRVFGNVIESYTPKSFLPMRVATK